MLSKRYESADIQLRNECLFSAFMGKWTWVRHMTNPVNREAVLGRFSEDLSLPHPSSFPMNAEKLDAHSLYLQYLQIKKLDS